MDRRAKIALTFSLLTLALLIGGGWLVARLDSPTPLPS
jgi:hypothetical protein